ncbi:hypothetical protein [Hydrogenophaga taeniospiralis]|uniref:hypothetical protein n=1 Tax=Hydrogenophaga taeniospiralis TaxID=65656 RepID=UPI001CF9A0F3|nr:hypothetical protein [Hydrogenophaga taeniospiralis]UCU95204.1 hypothetical protein KI616_04900 [Hydrogenophaga taeniospiralis]
MKKRSFLSLCAIAVTVPSVSHAQLSNLLSIPKLLGGGSSNGADLTTQQTSLVRNYVAAGKDVMQANTHLAEALGVQAAMVNAKATSDSLSASEIEEQDKAISANAAAISEALKSNAKLKDTEAKTTYAKGLLVLAQGVKKYVGMNKDVGGMSSSLSSASPMQLMNLQPSVYVVKNLPASITNVSDALRNAINFAQSNGVEIPKDVASVQSLI